MATQTRAKIWDFSDDSIYDLTDDAEIAANELSLTDPITSLQFNAVAGRNPWTSVPSFDGNGDAILGKDVTYLAEPGGTPLNIDDGIFSYWAKTTEALSANTLFETYMRHGGSPTTKLNASYKQGSGTRIIQADTATVAREAQWGDDWTSPTWREFILRVKDDEMHVRMGVMRAVNHEHVDKTDGGTVGLYQTDSDDPVVVGNGGAKDAPFTATRRTGACELNTGWTIPEGTTALGRMTIRSVLSFAVSGKEDPGDVASLAVALQYKITGGSWTDVPDDGDLSGVSFTAGTTQLFWRIDDGNGIGLDNGVDPRYLPVVHAVAVSYEAFVPDYEAEDAMREVLTNLQTAIDNDATVSAYDGWDRARVLWPTLGEAHPFNKFGVFLVPNTSREHTIAYARNASDDRIEGKVYRHEIDVWAWRRLDKDLEDEVLDSSGLLTFAENVKDVFRANTLSDSVQIIHVGDASYATLQYGIEPEDCMPGVRIPIEVEATIWEGT